MKKQIILVTVILTSLFLLSCQGYSSAENSEQLRVDDMILEKSFIKQVRHDDGINAQAAGGYGVYGSQPWKKGIMPIAFSAKVTQSQRDWLIKAAQKWSPSTGVSIVMRTTQADYLYIDNSQSGCFSEVGARAGLVRSLNLGTGCWTEAVTLHELGHALGLMHEHQRPDRDSYIHINAINADPSIRYAFDLLSTMNNETPYDFYSIMHYSQYAFSNNKQPTMVTLPKYAAFQNVMGINKISDLDRKSIAAMYAKTIAGK